MKKAGQKVLQTFLKEIRFRIQLKHSEWKTQARISFKLSSTEFNLESNWNIVNEISRPEIPNLSKFYSTKFDLESNCNFLNEKGRPEIPSNFPQQNSIQNQIETLWMKNASQNFLYLCKISSTKFDLESKWNILNEKRRPEFSISSQKFFNEIRFRIKLQLSEWKRQARNSFKLSSTKFDSESNWNIVNEKGRPEFPMSLQNFLNEVWFGIKLKHSEWKTQARNSYIFAKFTPNETYLKQSFFFFRIHSITTPKTHLPPP